MAIDISNDKRKFIQNLYANNKLDPRSEEQLNAILEYELSKESENPDTYNFEESAMAEFKAKHEVDKVLPDLLYKSNIKITDAIKEDDFKLDEKSFVEKARKVYPDFKFKKAKFGVDAFKITNNQGDSKVIKLNPKVSSMAPSTGEHAIKGNQLAFQQLKDFIKTSDEGVVPGSNKQSIYQRTGLKEEDYYNIINITGEDSVSKPDDARDSKLYTKKMDRLVDKVEEITSNVITNPGKYSKELSEDMNMFDTEWLKQSGNEEHIRDIIYEGVVKKSNKYLGGKIDRSSFNKILDRGGLYEKIFDYQVKVEKINRLKEQSKFGSITEQKILDENNYQKGRRTPKQQKKVELVAEIRKLTELLKDPNITDEDKALTEDKIKNKQLEIKRNSISSDVTYTGGLMTQNIKSDKDLASTFLDLYDDPDDVNNMVTSSKDYIRDLPNELDKVLADGDIPKSKYEGLVELRNSKIIENELLDEMGFDKKIKIHLDGDRISSETRSKIMGISMDGDKVDIKKDNTISLPYSTISAKVFSIDYNNLKTAVSKEDFNWIKNHRAAKQKNDAHRRILYDTVIMNRDPGEMSKPGFLPNFVQTVVSSNLQELFNYSKNEADKIATLSDEGRIDTYFDNFQELISEYNETYGEDNPITLTKKQLDNLTKTFSASVAEGAGHFTPIIAKFKAIGMILNPLLKITGVSNNIFRMTQSKNLYTRLEGHFVNSALEEVKGQAAGFGLGTMSIFYGANVGTSGMKLNAMWNPIWQKVVKQGVTGMSASEMSTIFEEGMLNENKDFKSTWNELYGEYSDFEKRMLVSVINFKMLGATHIKPIDAPWNRTINGLKSIQMKSFNNKLQVIKQFEKDVKDGKVDADKFIIGVEKYKTFDMFALGKAPSRYQDKYNSYERSEIEARNAFDATTKAYEISPENPNFEKNVKRRLLDPANRALSEVIGKDYENVEIKFIENAKELGEGNVAEYNPKTNIITAVKGKFNPELFNHEITHAMLSNYFKANPKLQMNFTRSLAFKFRKFNFEIKDPFTGEVKNIKDFIKENYGKNGKVMDLRSKEARIEFNNEFISYAMQLLTRPELNKSINAPTVIHEIRDVMLSNLESMGMRNDIKSIDGLINGMARLGRDMWEGNVSSQQIKNLLEGLERTGVLMKEKSENIVKPESFNMKNLETGTREINDFINNQFREVDWKNMSREQKIEFGEVAGMYYEPVIKGYLKNRFPDLKQQQIEDIATEFMGSKPGGFAKMIAAFDINKNKGELTGFFWNEKQIPKKIISFVDKITGLKLTIDKPAFESEGAATTFAERIEATGDKTGEITIKSNKVDPTILFDPKDVIKMEDIVKDKKITYTDPNTMHKNYSDLTIEFAKKVFKVGAEGKNAYSQADVNNVIAKLNEKVEHNGKKITIAELIFQGMAPSNVNPVTGKAQGVAEIMQRYLMSDVIGRASGAGGKSRQGTGAKTMKTWEEIGGIEGINKIFEQEKSEGKRGEKAFGRGWVEQYNRLLGNTVVRRKAKLEDAEAEVLEQMAGGYINLAAKEIKSEWIKIPGMTAGKFQYYINEYNKDQDKFKANQPKEIVNLIENIGSKIAYNKFMSGKSAPAHYDLSKINYRDITLKDGTKIEAKDVENVSNEVTYLTRALTRNGKKVYEVNVDKVKEYITMSEQIAEYLPKGLPQGLIDGLLGLHFRTTGLNKGKMGDGFNKLISSKTGENFNKIESFMNPTSVYNNVGKNSTIEFSKKELKSLDVLTKAYKDALKLREKGKVEEADQLLENKFSQLNEKIKRDLYYEINSAKQRWIESAKTKKEYLRRVQHTLTMGKLQDNVRQGERALVPIHAVYLRDGKIDGSVKLEHIESMVQRSLETAKAIIEGRWIRDGKKLTESYKAVLGEKNSFDISDLVGGRTNISGMARLTSEVDKLKDYYIVGEKGITDKTLHDQIIAQAIQSVGKMSRNLRLPYIKDALYKYAVSKTAANKIVLEKAIDNPKWAKIHARHVQAVIKSGLRADKNMSTSQLAELLELKSKATEIYLSPNAKKNGASVYDLDRTLYEGIEKVLVKMPNGKQLRLNSEEFAREYETIQKEGGQFDFSQFDKILGNKKGPLFEHLLRQQEQHGSEHLYVLTARAPGATMAIRDWLKTNGVNMSAENIVTLQDGRPEAKANWFIGKIVEKNYNDMFFADDIKANVNAVGKILDNLGINSKLRDANTQAAKDLSADWNKMIEETTGVESFKEFSAATAKIRGKDIDKWRWWLPSGAQHFLTLNYKFFGKGKKGDKHMEWFNKVLAEPYAKANYKLNIERARLRDDYKALLKDYSGMGKMLKKDTGYRDFTYEHAARVYLWDQMGVDMVKYGLSKKDKTELVKIAKSNPELQAFADQLPGIANVKEGYIPPNSGWVGEGIAHDVRNIGAKLYRKEALQQWVENKNEIFNEKNLLKIESIYGKRYREALDDILYRMEFDTNKSFNKDRTTNQLSKWISNATATVMFLNRRSALTQTISSLNFIEATGPNNILAATGAFAGNQKQYWKDFAMIFNSPMLKQRRLGNKLDVNYEELINTMSEKKDPITAATAWMLEKGFIFTKGADSFAIAFGGSAYYRNYVNSYMKQGMSKVKAEKAAFLKFQEASEPAQQSTRPDLISKQQASNVGRFVLNFQNVSIQNNNNMYRGILDIANGRGDMKKNISKILYYGAVQNVIFLGLQQAAFSAYFDPEEGKVTDKAVGIGNGMLDILLRGSGIGGAVVSTLKNTLLEYVKQTQRGWKADQAKVLIQALNFSPPIGSKSRKFYDALQDDKFSKETTVRPPLLAAEAMTNIPFNEFYELVEDGAILSQQELENWQRLSIILGFRPWQVGVDDKQDEKEKKGGDIKMQDIEMDNMEMEDIKIN
tara:strand:- start:654 stop:9263 length:8610 start_codon:yes stop_codon:yes gene_type:complete